jgi:hypothetical protein
LTGLKTFEIKHFDLEILNLTATFDLSFKSLHINGKHVTKAAFSFIPISGDGVAKIIFNDVRLNGTLQINTINDGYLNLKTLKVNITSETVDSEFDGFGWLDGTINEIVSEYLPVWIQNEQTQVLINNEVRNKLLPRVNEPLNKQKLIDVIKKIIEGIEIPDTEDLNRISPQVILV